MTAEGSWLAEEKDGGTASAAPAGEWLVARLLLLLQALESIKQCLA
jgi:hypothetical protein